MVTESDVPVARTRSLKRRTALSCATAVERHCAVSIAVDHASSPPRQRSAALVRCRSMCTCKSCVRICTDRCDLQALQRVRETGSNRIEGARDVFSSAALESGIQFQLNCSTLQAMTMVIAQNFAKAGWLHRHAY